MSKSKLDFEFGTFEERLAHACNLFDLDAPPIGRDDDGEIFLSPELMRWVSEQKSLSTGF